MKKLIIGLILSISLGGVVAEAVEGEWYMPSNTKIIGRLYFYGTDTEMGQASTINKSNNYPVKVKLYASDTSGNVIPGSWVEGPVKQGSTWVKSTARRPNAWGSGHSTNQSKDPWKWLYIGA